jgi:hypothetical protein
MWYVSIDLFCHRVFVKLHLHGSASLLKHLPGKGLDDISIEWRRGKPFKVSHGDKDAYKIMIALHHESILSINGITDEISFPFPVGRIAFEQMMKVCCFLFHSMVNLSG